jgi:peptide/nickel transport system permease protein
VKDLSSGLGRLRHYPLGLAGLAIVSVLVLAAIFADVLAPHDPNAINVPERMQGASLTHLLGTDQLGRDIFSRVLMGGRVALGVALTSISLALVIGIALGILAGYGPRWLDYFLVALFDTLLSFPRILFALAVVALVGPSLGTVILVVVITSIPGYGRVARTKTLSLRESEFIQSERAMGASMPRVLAVHLLPNVVGPLLILASMDVPAVIAMEAGLSFLGMGVRPPTPSWGSLLNDGYTFFRNTPWPIIGGILPLVFVTLGFTFLGESLLDIFDPKTRKEL